MWFFGMLSKSCHIYKYTRLTLTVSERALARVALNWFHLRRVYAAPCHQCHVKVITVNISHSFYKNCTTARKVKLSLITKTAVMDSKHETKRGLISERKSRHPATYIVANKNNISSLILARSPLSLLHLLAVISHTHTCLAVINSWPVPFAAVLACDTSG